MRTWLIAPAVMLGLAPVHAPVHAAAPPRATFDHQALAVRDLAASARFYADVLLLEEIPIPAGTKGLEIRWFSLGNGTALHLIKQDTQGIVVRRAIHLALAVTNFDGFLAHLAAKNIAYGDYSGEKRAPNVRADGVRQVYLQDPDGYWIEINDAQGR